MAVGTAVAGGEAVNMLAVQAVGAMIGVAVAVNDPVTEFTGKIFGDFSEVFGHNYLN